MSTDWIAVRYGGLRWRVRPGVEGWLRAQEWRSPEADAPGVRVVQRWGSRVSALLEGIAPGGGDLFVKWYGVRHAGEAIRFSVLPSRAAKEWRMNERLAAAGMPVAECLAVGERRTAGLWRGGVLVLRALAPVQTLAGRLREASESEARRWVDATAALVARLHDRGFCHHDLHGDNLLLDRESGRVVLTDLHETTCRRVLPERDWVGELARLNGYTPGSRRWRLRFWARYARARKLDRSLDRDRVRAIDRETKRLWERHFLKRGTHIERY